MLCENRRRYTARSLRNICPDLGCRLLHAGKGDAAAKGVIERWHRTWREEIEDELPREVIAFEDLCAAHFAWLAREYHLRVHGTTGSPPRERFLAELEELRPAPPLPRLTEIFWHRDKRVVRKDATVRWGGGYLEVRPELVGKEVELRFDPCDDTRLPKVYRDGDFVCDTVPLDRLANMHRARRCVSGEPAPDVEPSGIDLYRAIAGEVGVRPSHRRGQLWSDIKQAMLHMVDERGVALVVVIDEAQHLSDTFLTDLAGFLNFAFDSPRSLDPVAGGPASARETDLPARPRCALHARRDRTAFRTARPDHA